MHIVSVNVGTRYPDVYVSRLYLMCLRYLPKLDRFTCFTDRDRDLPEEIEQVDCSDWGLTGWWTKLKLFDRSVLAEEFLFMDLDQIILKPLDPLVSFAESHRDVPMIAMRDFYYKTLSSNVLLVRPSETTQIIWDSYARGEMYEAKKRVSGDQDFIEGCAQHYGFMQSVALLPSEWFVSYNQLRKLAVAEPSSAQRKLAQGMFLVFHGRPKPHEVLLPVQSLLYLLRHKPLRTFQYWRFLEREIREWWCLDEGTTAASRKADHQA